MLTVQNPKQQQHEHELQLIDPTPNYFGNRIRVLLDSLNDNAPWFVVPDIAKALDIRSSSVWNIVQKLDTKDVYTNSISISSARKVTLVSEPGFYELVLGSRKPGAVAFKRWVCSEVLPSIRRYGQYQALADDNDNPVDIPEVMVELVNLNKYIPAHEITDQHNRIHVWEYCDVFELTMDQQQRSALGKIARRLLITYGLPTRKTWKTTKRYSTKNMKFYNSGVYPLAILDLAYQEFIEGRKD